MSHRLLHQRSRAARDVDHDLPDSRVRQPKHRRGEVRARGGDVRGVVDAAEVGERGGAEGDDAHGADDERVDDRVRRL